jgi:hypothetical protein
MTIFAPWRFSTSCASLPRFEPYDLWRSTLAQDVHRVTTTREQPLRQDGPTRGGAILSPGFSVTNRHVHLSLSQASATVSWVFAGEVARSFSTYDAERGPVIPARSAGQRLTSALKARTNT